MMVNLFTILCVCLSLLSEIAYADIILSPPFQDINIYANSKAIINYEGIIDYNYLYCREQSKKPNHTLIAQWIFNNKNYREKINGAIIFDFTRVKESGNISIINNNKNNISLSCEYEFEPPSI